MQDQHWWYLGMQRITVSLLANLCPHRTDLRILDAGCGTGAAMHYLSSFGAVTGCDLAALALRFCQQRKLSRLSQASVTHLPFGNECFDLVVSLEVLYHRAVGDYHHALSEFQRVLKSGGWLILRLPAYNWLRGHHDEITHAAHRFTANELQQALIISGFTVEKLSYANTLLFPLALSRRMAERVFPRARQGSDIHPNPPWQDKFLSWFLFAEAKWLTHYNLPFGLTVIAVGRKQ